MVQVCRSCREGTEVTSLHGQQQDELPSDHLTGPTHFDQQQLLGTEFLKCNNIACPVSMLTMVRTSVCLLVFLPCAPKQCISEANLEHLHIVHNIYAAAACLPIVPEINVRLHATKFKQEKAITQRVHCKLLACLTFLIRNPCTGCCFRITLVALRR